MKKGKISRYFVSPHFYFEVEWYDEEDKGIHKFLNFVKEKIEIKNRLFYNSLRVLKPVFMKMYGFTNDDFENTVKQMSNVRINRFDEYVNIKKIKKCEMCFLLKKVIIIREGEKVKNLEHEIIAKINRMLGGEIR